MRYVIAAAAFLIPLLIAVAIGTACIDAGSGAGRAHLDAATLNELREFARQREALLERYVCQPGQSDDSMPHLALERFDRRGCDLGGPPWYRLDAQRSPLPCGLVRRVAPGVPPAAPAPLLVDGRAATLVLPLTVSWAYWETAPSSPPGP